MEWWNELQERWQAMFGENAALLGDVLLATLVSFAALGVYRVLKLIHGRVANRIASWLGRQVGSLRFQNQELLSAEEMTGIFVGGWRVLGLGLFVLGFYVYLQTVFGIFSATQQLAEGLLRYLLDGGQTILAALIGFIPNLIFLALLFVAARWLLRLLDLFFNGIKTGRIHIPGFHAEFAEPTHKIIRVIIVAFLAVMAFPYLPGSSSPAFQGVSIFLGVLVSLGSSGAVSNFISGIVLTYMRAFHVGDRVRIADAQGDVVERTVFVTRLRTPKNVDISIPNAMVLANHIINFSARAKDTGVILHTTVTIGYDVPWPKVEELLMAAAEATSRLEREPAPFVHQPALDDFYVHYELNATTRVPAEMSSIYSELHRNIQDRFHAAGIEIASPHLSALRDGNRAQIPEDYLPKDYKAPSFRFLPFGGGGARS